MILEYMYHHKEAVYIPLSICPITKRIYSDHLVHIPSPGGFIITHVPPLGALIVTIEYMYHTRRLNSVH